MGFDPVLTQFATKTQQNEEFRKGVRIPRLRGSGLESVERYMSGRGAAW